MFSFDKDGNFVILEVESEETTSKKEEKDDSKSGINVWTVIKNLFQSKEKLDWDSIRKVYNKFLINRALISNKALIPLIVLMNKYSANIPNDVHYEILHDIIPKRKGAFYPYIKAKEYPAEVMLLAKYYKINPYNMMAMMGVMNKDKKDKLIKKITMYNERKEFKND